MKSRDAVAPLRQRGQRHGVHPPAVMRQRAQRVIVAPARQPDLPEHRRQHRRHPHRLLAVVGTLQRVRHGDQRAAVRHAAGQRGDGVRRDAGDRGRPGGILGLAVAAPGQVVLEHRIADAVAREEIAVVQAFRHQRMRQAEHQRGVRAGNRRQPLRLGLVRQVGAQRADQHEMGAARVRRAHRAALDMPAGAAGRRPRCSSAPCRRTRPACRYARPPAPRSRCAASRRS